MFNKNKELNRIIKIVIISINKEEYIEKKMAERDVQVENPYIKCNTFFRKVRTLWFKYKLPLSAIWFNKGLRELDCDIIIVRDPIITADFIKWLKKNNQNKRIIFWYWNPVRSTLSPKSLVDNICEKWSYSPIDCENFKLKYNTTFYFKNLSATKEEPIWDIFFIGKDKGRLNELLDLKSQFEKLNLITDFHVTPTNPCMIESNPIYKAPIPYDEVLSKIGKSKAILDILSDPSDGLSLRPMESIFHKKKLITNSKLIVNYDFYRPQNIFILGQDDLNYLPKFINSPYEEIDIKIIKKYDFESWLNRFFKEV